LQDVAMSKDPRSALQYDKFCGKVSAAAIELQRALRAVLDQICPQLNGGRACGRALGLRRQLGWQVYSVAHASDYPEVLRTQPGLIGWTMAIAAMRTRGGTKDMLRHLEACVQSMDALITAGKADPALIRSVAAGALDDSQRRGAMLRARRAAARATELIHGVSAKALISSFMIGPAGVGGQVDVASVTQFHGVRRSRAGSAWPLYYLLECHDSQRSASGVARGVFPRTKLAPLVRDCSSPSVDDSCLRLRSDGETRVMDLMDRGTDRGTEQSFAFLERIHSAGSIGGGGDPSRSMFLITVPLTRAVVEVWVHKSIPLLNDPSGSMISSPNLNRRVLEPHGVSRLPLEASVAALDGPKLPKPLSDHAKNHHELLRRAAKTLGAPLSEFVGYQLVVSSPPWMSMLVLTYDV
jgi:hypothetical protein